MVDDSETAGPAPRVSVIMNCFNSDKYLREAIDSVYAQTFPDWEIIFLDNASTDGSAAIATSYDSRLRYFANETKVPLGQARNAALEKARGEYVAFLDCDDIWLPEKLARQIPLFEDPAVGLVFSDVMLFNQRGYARPQYGDTAPPQGYVFEKMVVFDNFICLSTAVVRGDVIRKQGHWFDPTLTVIEDTELFARICRDWTVAYAPHVLCKYRMHAGSMSHLLPLVFFDEQEQVIEKYSRLFPEFQQKYADAIRTRMRRDRAVLEWKRGNRLEARRMARPIIFKGIKYCVAYCAMAAPYEIVHRLRILFSSRGIANYE